MRCYCGSTRCVDNDSLDGVEEYDDVEDVEDEDDDDDDNDDFPEQKGEQPDRIMEFVNMLSDVVDNFDEVTQPLQKHICDVMGGCDGHGQPSGLDGLNTAQAVVNPNGLPLPIKAQDGAEDSTIKAQGGAEDSELIKDEGLKRNQSFNGAAKTKTADSTTAKKSKSSSKPKEEDRYKLVHVTVTALALSGLTVETKSKKTSKGNNESASKSNNGTSMTPINAILSIAKQTTSSDCAIYTHIPSMPVVRDPVKGGGNTSSSSNGSKKNTKTRQHLLAVWPTENDPTEEEEENKVAAVELSEDMKLLEKATPNAQLGSLISSVAFTRLIGISRFSSTAANGVDGAEAYEQESSSSYYHSSKGGKKYKSGRSSSELATSTKKKKGDIKTTYMPSLVEFRVCIMRDNSEIIPVGVARVAVSGDERDVEMTIPVVQEYWKSVKHLSKKNAVADDKHLTGSDTTANHSNNSTLDCARFKGAKKESYRLEPDSFLRIRLQIHSDPQERSFSYPVFNPRVSSNDYIPKGEEHGQLSHALRKKYKAHVKSEKQLKSLKSASSSVVVVSSSSRTVDGMSHGSKKDGHNDKTKETSEVTESPSCDESSFGGSTVGGVNPLDPAAHAVLNNVPQDTNVTGNKPHILEDEDNKMDVEVAATALAAGTIATVALTKQNSNGSSTSKKSKANNSAVASSGDQPELQGCCSTIGDNDDEESPEKCDIDEFTQSANCIDSNVDDTSIQVQSCSNVCSGMEPELDESHELSYNDVFNNHLDQVQASEDESQSIANLDQGIDDTEENKHIDPYGVMVHITSNMPNTTEESFQKTDQAVVVKEVVSCDNSVRHVHDVSEINHTVSLMDEDIDERNVSKNRDIDVALTCQGGDDDIGNGIEIDDVEYFRFQDHEDLESRGEPVAILPDCNEDVPLACDGDDSLVILPGCDEDESLPSRKKCEENLLVAIEEKEDSTTTMGKSKKGKKWGKMLKKALLD